MYYSDNPVLDEMRRTAEWDRAQENNIGYCIQCGRPILKGDDYYDGEEYIETEDGLVHWECWTEYGLSKVEVAK